MLCRLPLPPEGEQYQVEPVIQLIILDRTLPGARIGLLATSLATALYKRIIFQQRLSGQKETPG